jgi:hypothetical protein
MSVNIQTIKEIRPYLATELNSLYPETEISAIANIIIKTLFKVSKLHITKTGTSGYQYLQGVENR